MTVLFRDNKKQRFTDVVIDSGWHTYKAFAYALALPCHEAQEFKGFLSEAIKLTWYSRQNIESNNQQLTILTTCFMTNSWRKLNSWWKARLLTDQLSYLQHTLN